MAPHTNKHKSNVKNLALANAHKLINNVEDGTLVSPNMSDEEFVDLFYQIYHSANIIVCFLIIEHPFKSNF